MVTKLLTILRFDRPMGRLWSIYLCCLLVACATTVDSRPGLFSVSTRADNLVDETLRSRSLRYRFVEVAPEFVEGGGAMTTLMLNLFDEVVIHAVRQQWERHSANSFSWVGKAENMADSQVTLIVENGIMVGSVRMRDAFYSIRSAQSGGGHVVYQMNPRAFPAESAPLQPKR